MAEVADTCPYIEADLTHLLELEPDIMKCPFPLYEALREQAPVTYNHKLKGFLVSRYNDIVEVLREPEMFSSAMASGPSSVTALAKQILEDPAQPQKLRQQAARRLKMSESPVLLFTDPPLHKRQRMLVSAAFHPRRVNQLEPEVRRLTTALIDGFAADGETVVLLGRTLAKVQAVADEIGAPHLAIQCDVADPDSVRAAFATIAERQFISWHQLGQMTDRKGDPLTVPTSQQVAH